MSIIVNNDPLTFVMTEYGLERISEALYDTSVNLTLFKIKVGDANGEYYTPSYDQTELVHPITNGSFYIIEKALLEDGETVSFRVVIPETFGNCDIREVGLYETINGEDVLFAVGTQQPFVKPSAEYKYFISLDYSIFLKSVNLAEVYEQIILDVDNQAVTTQDFEDLMNTIVFAQGNLSQQIGENSRIIGLNRGTQLYEKMVSNRENFGYIETYNNYTTLLNYINQSEVFGYWVFNYPRRATASSSVIDIGPNSRNFSTSKAINLYDRNYCGIMPTLVFNTPEYFYLDSSVEMSFVDTSTNEDKAFSMMFTVKPLATNATRTLLARSNYATGTHIFEINELSTGNLQIILFADSTNYITFTSADKVFTEKCHSVVFSYENYAHTITAYVDGQKVEMVKEVTGTYAHMNTAPTTLYAFAATPYEVIYANAATTPLTALYNSDGSPYTGNEWALESGAAKYKNSASSYDSSKNRTTDLLYAWNYNDGVYNHTIYTKDSSIGQYTVLYSANHAIYTGTEFAVINSGGGWIIQYSGAYTTTYTSSMNIAPKTIYAWVSTQAIEKIWTNSSTAPSILLTSEGELYQGTDWTLNGITVTYKGRFTAAYNSQYNVIIPVLGVGSYVTAPDGTKTQLINSEVGIVAVINNLLSSEELRILSLNLEAFIGKNPCLMVN